MPFDRLKRREFITLLGGGAAWPLAAHAQQPALPLVGSLYTVSAAEWQDNMVGFRRGLGEAGFVDGRNVKIEYRWANGQLDLMPKMASDLVRRRVTVIATPVSSSAALAAKAATAIIPIVFSTGVDPVEVGLVPTSPGSAP